MMTMMVCNFRTKRKAGRGQKQLKGGQAMRSDSKAIGAAFSRTSGFVW